VIRVKWREDSNWFCGTEKDGSPRLEKSRKFAMTFDDPEHFREVERNFFGSEKVWTAREIAFVRVK